MWAWFFHSDRGGQYIANSFISLLKANGMEQSLSAKGRPCDNAVAESFFSIIKKEEIYRYQYMGINDFRKSVDSYIEYYNERRVHSFLGNMSPAQFEAKYCGKNDNDRSIFFFFSFLQFRICAVKRESQESPKYKGKMNSAVTDFDNFVQNRLPHYYGGE